MTKECPCNGEHNRRWHDRNGVPVCLELKERENSRRQVRKIISGEAKHSRWFAGTPILVEEIEEL